MKSPQFFCADLAQWFGSHGKSYPWRETQDPYAILVSEVMLQQTQIPTVLERGFYTRWMERFPTVQTLAAAREEDVLKAWEGLGYYRRARNLQKLAQVVMAEHGGHLPRNVAGLLSLPGIGPYTAGAVASFAYDVSAPIVDGNVARVLSRIFNDPTPIDSTAGLKKLWDRAGALVVGAESPRIYNAALMELGQTHCRPGVPSCQSCPVRSYCTTEDPAALPVKGKKVELTDVTERVFYLETAKGIWLQHETGSRRTGMWRFPELAETATLPPVIYKGTYGITRYRVVLWVHQALPSMAEIIENSAGRWVPHHELDSLTMPSPYRRALEAIMKDRSFTLR